MARPEKVAEVEEVADRLSANAATLLTDYRGLSVAELSELRAELRKANATYRVVKNTLTRRAAAEAGIEGLDPLLVGPTALVFCENDPVGPAKALRDFSEEHPDLIIKAGWVEGELLDDEATSNLANLESRHDLLTSLVSMMDDALAGFARLMQAASTDMLQAMKALAEDGGPVAKGFDVPGEEPPAEPEAAEEPAAEEPPAAEAADEDEPEPEAPDEDEPEPEAEAADEDESEPEAADEDEPEPEAADEDEPEPEAPDEDEPEPEAEAADEDEPEPEAEAADEDEPEPEAADEDEPEPEAADEDEPEPEPEPEAADEDEPEPEAADEDEPEPDPADEDEPEAADDTATTGADETDDEIDDEA